MVKPFDLTGKKILVTGASAGIGKSTAIYLAELGATLVISGRNSERLFQIQALLKGTCHISIVSDLTALEDARCIYEQTVSNGVKLDRLVHSCVPMIYTDNYFEVAYLGQ